MVVEAGYEAYRRSAESTSRDQTGELQPMEQVGTHAPALLAAQAGSTERYVPLRFRGQERQAKA